jgi:hypothetical protein
MGGGGGGGVYYQQYLKKHAQLAVVGAEGGRVYH